VTRMENTLDRRLGLVLLAASGTQLGHSWQTRCLAATIELEWCDRLPFLLLQFLANSTTTDRNRFCPHLPSPGTDLPVTILE